MEEKEWDQAWSAKEGDGGCIDFDYDDGVYMIDLMPIDTLWENTFVHSL